MKNSTLAVLWIGILLSVIIMIPPIRFAMESGNFFTTFNVVFHVILFMALILPFLLIYFIFRKSSSTIAPVALGITFSLCHLWIIYATYAYPPQEFGYLGLVFAPLLEAVVAIPVALLIIFIFKKSHKIHMLE